MTDVMAVRTRYFDEFFTQGAKAGIRQAVILASGLDSRTHRLSGRPEPRCSRLTSPRSSSSRPRRWPTWAPRRWPTGAWWPSICGGTGRPRCGWPALTPTGPTAWIAEGLLGYLPPDAQDRLLDHITTLSAEGSRFAADAVPNLPQPEQAHFRQRIQALILSWRNHGFDVDMTDMVYLGERNDVAKYLNARGWETGCITTSELFVANGLSPVDEKDDDRAPFALAFTSARH